MGLVRKFAKYILIGYFGLCSACVSIKEKNEISSLVRNFSDSVPKAEVRKFYVKDSDKILVHLRNYHYVTNITKEQIEGVEKFQEDMYDVLSCLIENYGLKKVHRESMTVENKEEMKSCIKEFYSMKKEFEELIRKGEEDVAELKTEMEKDPKNWKLKYFLFECENSLDDMKESYNEVKDPAFCAISRLYAEGKIDILEGEDTEVYEKTKELWKKVESKDKRDKNTNRELLELTLERREDSTLKIMSESEDKIIFLIYGGLHAFGGKESCGKDYSLEERISLSDNIARWNKRAENKDTQFSLIEIMLEDYDFKN